MADYTCKRLYINGFSSGEFVFAGGWAFYEDDNEIVYLLAANGCHILLDKTLFSELEQRQVSDALKFKLVQMGVAFVKDSRSVIDRYSERCGGTNAIYPSFFMIDVTKICNLDCIYCFRDLNDKRIINRKVLGDICSYILDIVRAKKEKHVTIQMWGGEPLFAFDEIRYVYDFFSKNQIVLNLTVETNGTLLDEEKTRELKRMNVSVGVSIDGLPVHQELQRRLLDRDAGQTMPLVKRGLELLDKYYGNDGFGSISVITKHTYSEIGDIIRYFIYELNLHAAKFNLVKDNENAKEKSLQLSEEMIEAFAENLFDVVEAYNALGVNFREYNIQQRIDNLLHRSGNDCCDSNGCSGGFSIISFDYEGGIFPCELTDNKETKMGSIYNEGVLQNGRDILNVIAEAKKNNLYFKSKDLSKCKDCPWIYFCKGGCTSRTLYIKDSDIDKSICTYNKVIYQRIVNNIVHGKYLA